MKTIRKSQYNFLKLLQKYHQNRQEVIEISDEEYEELQQYVHKPIIIIDNPTGETEPTEPIGPTGETEPDNPTPEIQYDYTGYDFGVGPFAYNIISLEDQTVSINYIGNKNITEIIIPSLINYNGHKFTIIRIGSNAFSYCRRLININIPDSITTIGDNAFEGCWELINITIPDSVTIIGDNTTEPNYGVFAGCNKLTNVNIPNGITKISYGLFSGCNIININIPDSVTKIENYAFSNCDKLTNINIPNSVTTIEKYAFISCDNLHNFVTYSSIVFDIALSSNLQNIYCLPELIEQYTIKYEKEIFLGKINILDINTYT